MLAPRSDTVFEHDRFKLPHEFLRRGIGLRKLLDRLDRVVGKLGHVDID